MEFSVTRSAHALVPPSAPTPSVLLDLSFIDRAPVLRCNARTLHVFRHGPEAAKVISEALSKALVPYFPLAGRLKEDSANCQDQLQIECSGEGVWIVEAYVNHTLEDFNYFEDPMSDIPYDKLLPDHPPEHLRLAPLLLVQITQFSCNGFVMGLIFSHTICDGLGAAQFLKTVGEMAKGADQPSIAPVWCRDFIPTNSKFVNYTKPSLPNSDAIPTSIPDFQLEHCTVDIPFDEINELKQRFQKLTGGRQTCSTFEIVAASLWCHRTRAIDLKEDAQMKLVFFANCRHLLNPPLPEGFYGNCFFPLTVTASAGKLTQGSIAYAVQLIKEAKTGLKNEFAKWITREEGVEDPFAPPPPDPRMSYATLFVSEWGRLGFNEVDYGWGPPVHVVPVQGSSIIPGAIVSFVPSARRGIRVMTWCVVKAHLQPLLHHFASQAQHTN